MLSISQCTITPTKALPVVGVARAGDADVPVGVVGHERRALEAVADAERRHVGTRASVEDVDAVRWSGR